MDNLDIEKLKALIVDLEEKTPLTKSRTSKKITVVEQPIKQPIKQIISDTEEIIKADELIKQPKEKKDGQKRKKRNLKLCK